MNEPTKLYFDSITSDGNSGETGKSENILYNLNKIDPELYTQFSEYLFGSSYQETSTVFTHAGQYIIIASCQLNPRFTEMVALNLNGNEKAFDLMFTGNEHYTEIRDCFEQTLIDPSSFEIVRGIRPEPSDTFE